MYEEYDSFIACFERAEEKEIRHAGVEGQRKDQRVYGSDQGGRHMKKRRAEDMEDWELDDAVKRRKNEADYKRYSRSNQRRERAMERVKNVDSVLRVASGAAGLYAIAKNHKGYKDTAIKEAEKNKATAIKEAGKKVDEFIKKSGKKKSYASPQMDLRNVVIPKDVAEAAGQLYKRRG